MSKTPSILSAVSKLKELLTSKEKLECLSIIGFTLCTSILEVVTASIIVIFAQVINQPETGIKYLAKVGITENLTPGRIVFYIAVTCGIVYLIKNSIAAVEVFFQNFSIQRMNYRFKNKLLNRYANMDYGFYLTRNSSYGMSVVSGDVEQMFSTGMLSLATMLSELVVFMFLIAMVIYMNPSLFAVIFGVSVVLGFTIYRWILPLFYRWGKKLQHSAVFAGQHLLQFFYAFKEIVLLGKREAFIEAYQTHAKNRAKIQAIQTATNNLPRIIIEVLFVGLFVVTISYMCLNHEKPQQIIGVLGGYLYVGFRLMPGLNRMIGQLNTFKAAIPAVERVYNEYIIDTARGYYLDVPEFKFENNIVIKNAFFQYKNTNKDVLKNINITINKGECIGVIGETGSGKSTLIDVVLGLLYPYSGEVLIDNKYQVNSKQWHQKIGYVPQAIYLIDDTIEANIAFGIKIAERSHERIRQVIKSAQLFDFIEQLPSGLQTIVGERGIRLSGGERQRIAIARALYHQPEVLIFDEATSSLDNETEAKLMETINSVSKNRTVIMIAHRLTTLKDCARIIAMENGSIAQENSYAQIKAIKKVQHA